MKKGIIFSYDALLAIGIVILLFSGIMLVNSANTSDGKTRAMLYTKSADFANENLLLGNSPLSSPTKDNANCTEILEYESPSNIQTKGTTCAELG